MENYIQILRKVGFALIVIGLIDIAFMVYCISQGYSYSSSFNIFAVIAGVFLVRGGLKTARLVAWFSAFMLTGFIGIMLVFPLLKPLDLWAVELKLSPITSIISIVIGPAVIVFLFWVYRSLRSAPVTNAQLAAGINTSTPKLALVGGTAIVVFLCGMMYSMIGGENGKKAKEIAEKQYGNEYKYHVVSMNWSSGYIRANLAAYNQNEIKTVEVEWRE